MFCFLFFISSAWNIAATWVRTCTNFGAKEWSAERKLKNFARSTHCANAQKDFTFDAVYIQSGGHSANESNGKKSSVDCGKCCWTSCQRSKRNEHFGVLMTDRKTNFIIEDRVHEEKSERTTVMKSHDIENLISKVFCCRRIVPVERTQTLHECKFCFSLSIVRGLRYLIEIIIIKRICWTVNVVKSCATSTTASTVTTNLITV